jgi:hypothetical protein
MNESEFRVLFESSDEPKRYIIGKDDGDAVWLFDPESEGRPARPVPLASIANHMPHTQWHEYDGDDQQILRAFHARAAG